MLTVAEVAERLGAHVQTVRRWLREGRIQGVMPGGTKLGYRVPESEVRRLLAIDRGPADEGQQPRTQSPPPGPAAT